MKIGSLFSGYGGLEQGVQAVLGGSTAWVSDIDPGACKILAHRYLDVPNLGDISTVDWSAVEPVDVLTGGFPCQDVSCAGLRKGLRPDTRSGLWTQMAYAIDQLRPALVVAENVRGLLSAEAHSDLEPCPWCVGDGSGVPLRALGAVLGDLADIGYDASWTGLRAADVGAPHGRFRVFVVAWPAADADRDAAWTGREPRHPAGSWPEPAQLGAVTAADAERQGRGATRLATPGHSHSPGTPGDSQRRHGAPAPHPASDGRHEGRAEPARLVGGPDAALSGDAAADAHSHALREQPVALAGGCGATVAGLPGTDVVADADRDGLARIGRELAGERDADRRSSADTAWGDYEPAVRRWERLTRPAPAPTEPGKTGAPRLSPAFVEWMQGLPAGWVTDVPGLTRNEQLKALGNGVVPQQAAAALRLLLSAERRAAA